MNVLQILRFFLPGENPLGFGLADAIEFFVALLGFAAILLRVRILAGARWIAARPPVAMGLLVVLPGGLRLALLRHHPVPIPTVPDDFSFLLLADTLAHFRLANPVHPMHRFFESLFILQEPSYSSIYPLGQGIVLALFGHPWAGVLISAGIFAALCFWMLRAWVAPAWALCGGLIAVATFGPLNKWMNDYWGGALSAIAGCLVFGALPRLRKSGSRRDALLLGLGLAIQLLTRPFESLLLDAVVLAMLFPLRRQYWWIMLPVVAASMLTLAHNRAVTGAWLTLPYSASRTQYGVPATFTFQVQAVPHRPLTAEQQLAFEVEAAAHDHPVSWPERLRSIRFFLLPPLFAALPFALRRRWVWAFAVIGLFYGGTAFYPYFHPHYIAAVACLFLLLAVAGLERLSALRAEAAMVLLIFCAAHFAFWYGLHLTGNAAIFSATSSYEASDYINYGDAEGRIAIARQLAAESGSHLVFVRYGAAHTVREWVQNAANIDQARIVWALDRGEEEDRELRNYYPGRKAWLLDPDSRPPRLTPY